MADGHGNTDWVAWLVAALTTAGSAAAGAWAWLKRERKSARNEVARPYKSLFEALEKKLEKVTEGFDLSQREHAECRANVARLEERALFQEREIGALRAEVSELRAELAEQRRDRAEGRA